jgi:hypothetical protein
VRLPGLYFYATKRWSLSGGVASPLTFSNSGQFERAARVLFPLLFWMYVAEITVAHSRPSRTASDQAHLHWDTLLRRQLLKEESGCGNLFYLSCRSRWHCLEVPAAGILAELGSLYLFLTNRESISKYSTGQKRESQPRANFFPPTLTLRVAEGSLG